jgi:rRNA maturation RNase YbeY
MSVNFFNEDIPFILKDKIKRKHWLKIIATAHARKIGELNFIFCSDEYLHKINLDYLDHDTYTDIITFDNSEVEESIEGDVFISIDRVKENSNALNTIQEEEINRVISHGLFHLLGFKDKSELEATLMREKEQLAIDLYNSI